MTLNDNNNYCVILAGGKVEDFGHAVGAVIQNSSLTSLESDVPNCSRHSIAWQR